MDEQTARLRMRYLQLKQKKGMSQAPKGPELLKGMAQGARQALNIYNDSQLGSPQDLLGRAEGLVRSGANKAGEFVAEEAGRSGVNPYLAAGVGTAMQMAPDAIESAVMPGGKIAGPEKLFRPISRPMAQRSLGLTKRFLNTPFARGKAAQASDAALDQGVIPRLGNPKVAMDRAVDLQDKSGAAIGSMREAAGLNPIDPVFDSLEAARQRATGGMRGGAWDTVHQKFDEAQETLMGLLNDGPNVPLAKVEQAKKLLSKTVNWIADNVSQETAKKISGSIEAGVESIMRSKGIDMTTYNAQKGLYGASKTMQKGLANEVAAQAGNNAVSLPTMIGAAGQAAGGNIPGALGAVGVLETLRRRGAGAGARAIDSAGGLVSRQLLTARAPLRAVPIVQSFLKPRDPRQKSVLKPGYKFKRLFNNPEGSVNKSSEKSNRQMRQPDNNRQHQQGQNNTGGNLQNVQSSPKKLLGQRPAKVPTREILIDFLRKARGDKEKAGRMALQEGYDISKH